MVSLAAAYTPEELNNTKTGAQLSFKLGQAFEKASQGGDAAAFNALVDQWNAWVASTFGNDASLIMEKMTGPINLQKPYYAPGNNTDGLWERISWAGFKNSQIFYFLPYILNYSV
ncbi:MAG: hypothetical protein LUQ15_05130 [Methanothrix sp.]|nr:hypothetical protein [Methanothrix sp.]